MPTATTTGKRVRREPRVLTEVHEACGEEHPISDVFCTRQNWFLVNYPPSLIVALSGAGLLAFILVGYLGYNGRMDCNGAPTCLQLVLFGKPWPLYVWFTALVVTLQVSILRHRQLRPELTMTLLTTLISAAVMYWLYFYGDLSQLLNTLWQDIRTLNFTFLRVVFSQQWFYTIVNFGLIVLFLADSAYRWSRRARGLKLTTGSALTESEPADPNEPRVEEMAAGDLIFGLALFGVMALVFSYTFIHGAAAFSQIQADPNNPIPANVADVPDVVPLLGGVPLSTIDRLLALFCLPLGFIVLALYSTLNGLSALRGVVNLQPREIGGIERTEDSATAQVALVLANTLRAAVNRYSRLLIDRAAGAGRSVLWIVLIFVGSYSLAGLSAQVQVYLHNAPRQPLVIVAAGVAAVIAIFSIVFSAALLLNSRHVAGNTLRLLGWVGFVLGLTFWLFSITMVGIDWLGQQAGFVPPGLSTKNQNCPAIGPLHNLWNPTDPRCNQPFAASILTFSSFAFLVVLLIWLFVRQVLGSARPAAAPAARRRAPAGPPGAMGSPMQQAGSTLPPEE
jgi:hypothetical protein